jgi:hypothetical protein
MAFERKSGVVPPQLFTADGDQWGLVTVADTAGFRVKQSAYIITNNLPALPVQVKVVLSPTQLVVGHIDNQIANWSKINLLPYLVSNAAAIGAQEQDKNKITNEDIQKAAYEADPVVALRTVDVDQYGNFYTLNNPLPVEIEGSITLGEVEIKGSPSGNLLDINSDGSIKTIGLFTLPYDTIQAAYPATTQEVYTSYLGGAGGTLQQIVTVNYTDITKNYITSVLRTPVG